MSVIVTNLTKKYGQQTAVNNISFSINKGEVVGFLGPNGAGKSTTMKMISCCTLPTSGTAEINGYNILDDPMGVRKQIGYLPEQNPLYDDMYIREYLRFTAKIHGISKPEQRISEIIDMTGLCPEICKKIGQLSKGYKQRVGLAQALIHDPEVLLLDEPTSGLDPNQIIEIRNLIKETGREKTIILSSHILQEVQAMCNRVIIINQGIIIADDSTSKLLSQNAGKFKFTVVFKESIAKEDLATIPDIETLENKGDKWVITTLKEDIREELFDFAVKHKNVILEMNKIAENLETIFQELTLPDKK